MVTQPWPALDPALIDRAAEGELDWVIRLVSLVRTIRAEVNVPPSARMALLLKAEGDRQEPDGALARRIDQYAEVITQLARVNRVEIADGETPAGCVQDDLEGLTVLLPIADVIDVGAERARLAKEIARLTAKSLASTSASRTRHSLPRPRPRWLRPSARSGPMRTARGSGLVRPRAA